MESDDTSFGQYEFLKELVDQCLEFDPAKRPTFAELDQQLNEYFEAGDADSIEGYMRDARKGIQSVQYTGPASR